MNTPIQLLDVVALVHDRPSDGLVRGQVGTVVETLSPAVYEVEFSDDHGKTYAMLPLPADELNLLYQFQEQHHKDLQLLQLQNRHLIHRELLIYLQDLKRFQKQC